MKGLIKGMKKAVAKQASKALLIKLRFSFTGTKLKLTTRTKLERVGHISKGLIIGYFFVYR